MADPHLEAEHYAPAKTTPQGTQEYAAVGDQDRYEKRDVSLRGLIGWFGGLAIFTVALHLLLLLGYGAMIALARSRDRLPSPVFGQQRDPPGPRLLPNPVDFRQDAFLPQQGPVQHLGEMRKRENEELARYGLVDPNTKQPRLPEGALQAVAGAGGTGAPPPGQGSPAAPPTEPMPSDPSGGTADEDRLQ